MEVGLLGVKSIVNKLGWETEIRWLWRELEWSVAASMEAPSLLPPRISGAER